MKCPTDDDVIVDFDYADRIIRGSLTKEIGIIEKELCKSLEKYFGDSPKIEVLVQEFGKFGNFFEKLSKEELKISCCPFIKYINIGGLFYVTSDGNENASLELWQPAKEALDEFFDYYEFKPVTEKPVCDLTDGFNAIRGKPTETYLYLKYEVTLQSQKPFQLHYLFDYAIFHEVKNFYDAKTVGANPKNRGDRILAKDIVECELIAGSAWLRRADIRLLLVGTCLNICETYPRKAELRVSNQFIYEASPVVVNENWGCRVFEKVVPEIVGYRDRLEAKVVIGSVLLHQKEINQLKSGSVVVLENIADTHFSLVVEGVEVGKGEVQVLPNGLGFRVTEVTRAALRMVG